MRLKGRIICTADDVDSREMLVTFLGYYGFDFVCSVDSKHALDLAHQEDFDLFLLDNWMPALSGVDVTIGIREFNKTTPIIFYSGAVFPADRNEALNAGAQAYLAKPDLQALVEEIDRLIVQSKTTHSQILN